ncbi:MAG: hypothetical protein IT210_07180 [Armatimonadetes bacterium]|nr:hypothetical protein [Armatimonadota bacterium]
MRYITVSGTYYEQGRQHGAALPQEIERIIGDVLRPDGWDMGRVDRYLDLLEANMLRLCPGLVEEMRGIAEGAGIPYRQILTYNCLADIWQINAFCTNVSFQKTPEGPAIGKTNDIGKDSQHYHALFRREGGDGGPHLLATWPGTVWANCFVNGRGLAFGAASIVKRVRNEAGIPSNVLLRWLADSAGSVAEAVACLQETPVMHHPANITVADSEGRLAVIEKSPDGCEVREPDPNGVLFATNHFCTPGLSGTDAPEENLKENSLARFANLDRLTRGGEQSVERLKAILSDHTQPGAVCQHGHQDMWTSVAYIAVPRSRTLHFAYGRPCETEFVEFAL